MSIANFTRDRKLFNQVFGVCAVIVDVTSNPFDNAVHFRLSQGERELCIVEVMMGK